LLTDGARTHYERYWRLARAMFISGDYALATFLAITLMEEVGKIVLLGDAHRGDAEARKEFRKYPSKYIVP
jgi:AbiV family abortive infection protein